MRSLSLFDDTAQFSLKKLEVKSVENTNRREEFEDSWRQLLLFF